MLSDTEIIKKWSLAKRLLFTSRFGYRARPRYTGEPVGLGERLAISIADDLEAQGVTDADIDRLFPN